MFDNRYRSSFSPDSVKGRKRRHLLLRVALFPVQVVCFPFLLIGRGLQQAVLAVTGVKASNAPGKGYFTKKQDRPKTWRERLLWLALLPFMLVLLPFWLVWRLIKGVYLFINQARKKRRWRDLLWGLPAFLVGMGTLITAFLLQAQSSSLNRTYRLAANQAFNANNLDAAEVYLQRHLRLDSENDEMQFRYAGILESKGEVGRAATIMASLAPDDAIGYPPAHLWRAIKILSNPSAYTRTELLSCRHHLRVAGTELTGSVEVLEQQARFHIYLGELETALQYMRQAAALRPEFLYEVAHLQWQLQRYVEAEETFQRAERHFAVKLELNPRDHDARLKMAASLLGLREFDQAQRLLEEGIQLDPDQSFHILLAEALVARFDYELVAGRASDEYLFQLLNRALQYNVESWSAMDRLLRYGLDSSDPDNRQRAIEGLESFLTQGEGAALAHLALGIHYYKVDDTELSRFHLERAYALRPALADLANNLAWVLAHQDSPDLERALAIMESVLKDHPDNADYLDTRGRIYVKLGRWNDALHDLEQALPALRGTPEIHEILAEVYEHFGQTSLAQRHLATAEQLRRR